MFSVVDNPHLKTHSGEKLNKEKLTKCVLSLQDQHVITLQKLLQDFLESNLSESSEDNESNTSNQYQPGSCSPSSDDSSDQQPSRDNSPTHHMVHSPAESSHSCGSLNVLPNNSPAPSTDPGWYWFEVFDSLSSLDSLRFDSRKSCSNFCKVITCWS